MLYFHADMCNEDRCALLCGIAMAAIIITSLLIVICLCVCHPDEAEREARAAREENAYYYRPSIKLSKSFDENPQGVQIGRNKPAATASTAATTERGANADLEEEDMNKPKKLRIKDILNRCI